jgi:hypothetical protein
MADGCLVALLLQYLHNHTDYFSVVHSTIRHQNPLLVHSVKNPVVTDASESSSLEGQPPTPRSLGLLRSAPQSAPQPTHNIVAIRCFFLVGTLTRPFRYRRQEPWAKEVRSRSHVPSTFSLTFLSRPIECKWCDRWLNQFLVPVILTKMWA